VKQLVSHLIIFHFIIMAFDHINAVLVSRRDSFTNIKTILIITTV